MEEEQLGHWTPSLAGQPRSQAPATTSRGGTAGALLRVVALVWVPVLTELVMDGALLQVTALCYGGRGAPTHRGHAPMRPAPRTTCSHDAGKGPYGLRRLQPVERLQPRHEERTPVNCGLTMRPGSVIVCSMQQPHGTDGRTRGEETERLRTMLDRTQTPRTTIITVDAGNRPIVDVPSQHHAIYSLYRQPPPDYHQGQDAGRPAQRSQSTMDAVWRDESIVDTARTATMEQAPGQDDDRRPATLTPPLLPEPDKVTLTPQH